MRIKRNNGNIVVEASLVVPLFLFFSLAIFHMLQSMLADQVVYEAVVETAEYVAEATYLSEYDILFAQAKMPEYVDDIVLVDEYVSGGIKGVSFLGSNTSNNGEQLHFLASYRIVVPNLLGVTLGGNREITINKRAYLGDNWAEAAGALDGEEYVYITDNREAYHLSRCCSHLKLSITQVPLEYAKNEKYTPCEFCGSKACEVVFITTEGERYHSSESCSGLKRTVYRVKKSEVGNLSGCMRCVGE